MYNKEKNWVSNLPISYLGAVAHQEETDSGTHRLAGIIQVTEAIQVEEVMLETGNIHHPAEEAVKVIFIGHRPMNGRKALDSPGITGLVQK